MTRPTVILLHHLVWLWVVMVVTACQSKTSQTPSTPPAPTPLKVEAYVVRVQPIHESIRLPGTLRSAEQTELHAELSGRVTQLNISEGSIVNKGSLLVKLYDEDLQAQLKKYQVQLEIARRNEARVKELVSIRGATEQELDRAQIECSNIAAEIDVIKSSISKTEIRAPFNGKIGLRSISPGAFVTPSTVIASIRTLGSLKLDFDVPEKYSSHIRPSQIVRFTVNSDTTLLRARVIATETSVEPESRTLKVRADVESNSQLLVPGLFANVLFTRSSDTTAIMIPTQALIPQARDKKVIVVREGRARFVTVTTGFRSNDAVEIVSGLSVGDTVVTTGLLFVKPESTVSISRFIQ